MSSDGKMMSQREGAVQADIRELQVRIQDLRDAFSEHHAKAQTHEREDDRRFREVEKTMEQLALSFGEVKAGQVNILNMYQQHRKEDLEFRKTLLEVKTSYGQDRAKAEGIWIGLAKLSGALIVGLTLGAKLWGS